MGNSKEKGAPIPELESKPNTVLCITYFEHEPFDSLDQYLQLRHKVTSSLQRIEEVKGKRILSCGGFFVRAVLTKNFLPDETHPVIREMIIPPNLREESINPEWTSINLGNTTTHFVVGIPNMRQLLERFLGDSTKQKPGRPSRWVDECVAEVYEGQLMSGGQQKKSGKLSLQQATVTCFLS